MAFIRDLDRWRDNGAAKRATQDFLKARHLHRARAFFGFGAAGTAFRLLPGFFPSAITVLIHVAVLAVFSFQVLLWVWFPDGSILSPFTQNKLLRLQLGTVRGHKDTKKGHAMSLCLLTPPHPPPKYRYPSEAFR